MPLEVNGSLHNNRVNQKLILKTIKQQDVPHLIFILPLHHHKEYLHHNKEKET